MKRIISIVTFFAVCLGLIPVIYSRWRQEAYLSYRDYEVRGVDVSSYQGEIDWDTLARQNIQFAFLKATEGSSHTDSSFKKNLQEAGSTGLRIGAYHFFSFDSSGNTQADNYIAAVPKTDHMLPPVVDIEFYGDKDDNPPEKETVLTELSVLLDRLETYYGMKPIIYAPETIYRRYIAGVFDRCDIWISNATRRPAPGVVWTFWQYSVSAKLEGYTGADEHIDMNVFNGSVQEFDVYPKQAT